MKTRKRILSFLLTAALIVGMFPCTALAEDDKVLAVSVDNSVQMGVTEDDEAVYLYYAEDYDGETQVQFTDYSDVLLDGGMIASFGNAYVEDTDKAPISNAYLAGEDCAEELGFELYEDYEDFDFSKAYGYWFWNEDYEYVYFIIQLPEDDGEDISAPFTLSKGEVVSVEKNAYLYDDWSGSAVKADLYTVKVPFGTQDETISFSEDRIAYGYTKAGGYVSDCSGNENGYGNGGKTGEKKANVKLNDKGQMPGYVVVQTPYDDSWNSDTLYALTFENTYSFTANAGNEALSKIAYTKDGYKYDSNMYDSDNTGDAPVALYTITVPDGTEKVSLKFTDNVLAYNYKETGEYVYGYYDDIYSGEDTATVSVDYNKDGKFDVIQVQTPYDNKWNTDVLYGITFKFESGGNPPLKPFTKGQYTAEELVSSIASEYAKNGVENDGNYPWIAADMAAYAKTYPDTENVFDDAQKQIIADKLIALVSKSSASAGDLAKGILAFCALGYDPCQITLSDGSEFDAVVALLSIAFTDEDRTEVAKAVMSEYTLPWVISALWQLGDKYEDELNALVDAEVSMIYDSENDSCKLNMAWGSDGAAYVLSTIGPFYEKDADVKKAVDAVKKELKKDGAVSFNEDGAVFSWGSASAESTALLITGLAATGEDPDEFFDVAGEDGKKTVDIDLSKGLLSLQNADSTGFKSAGNAQITTEQGFRGLIALVNLEDNDSYTLYDFAGAKLEPVSCLKAGATFTVVPENAEIALTDAEGKTMDPVKEGSGVYELPAGEYAYTVSSEGYADKKGTVKITAEDVEKRARQNISVSLSKSLSDNKNDNITVTVKVLYHEADSSCKNGEGTTTYKNNSGSYVSALDESSYKAELPKGATARDALVAALDESGVSYVEESNGYFSSIDGYAELSHGPNSGWMYTVNKKAPDVSASQYSLKNGDVMVWYYTDDYTKESGSENFGPSGGSDKPDTDKKFVDVPAGAYYEEAVDWAVKNNVTSGTTETTFSPDDICTRAQTVTFLWRAAGCPEPKASDNPFTDVKSSDYFYKAVLWAVENGITKGTSEKSFSPDMKCTRAQVVTFINRMAGERVVVDNPFTDVEAGAYYYDAVMWAVENGITTGTSSTKFSPDKDCTRAQIVTFIYRYESMNKTAEK